MKKIILCLLTMMTFSLFADTTKQAIPDSTKITMGTIYNDAKEAMKGLGAALKVGSEHVYQVLVKQQAVKSIGESILILFLLILAIVGFKITKSTYKAHLILSGWKEGDGAYSIDINDSSKGVASVFLGIFTGIIIIAFIITFLSCYNSIVTGFVNPEYGALKEIMEFIKK